MTDKLSRSEHLEKLLAPIEWNWSSPVRARQHLVSERHARVNIAYPFFNDDEKAAADQWRERERHSGLWD